MIRLLRRALAPLLLRAASLGVLGAAASSVGCAHTRAEKVPGETDIEYTRVVVESRAGAPEIDGHGDAGRSPKADVATLLPKLGSRVASALYTARRFNPFRIAEDRRRVQSFLATYGYLDAEVDQPEVLVDERARTATLRIRYDAHQRYTLADLRFDGLPEGESLDGLRKATPGGAFDLEELRVVRYDMASALQRRGYGHAQVYVRHYVDRAKKQVHVVYFVDAGPKTRVGRITVEGNKRVDEADIRKRLGLAPGDAFDLDAKERAEADLRDTGSFNQVVIETSGDTEMYLGDVPDSGGVIADERIDASGKLVPRTLPATIDLIVHVDEAPKVRVKLRASAELDPTRVDLTAGANVDLLDALGSGHQLLSHNRVGFGWLWRGDSDQPTGLYGDALLRYVRPGLIGRIGDGRMSVRFRDVFYPGFHLRELTAGPGVRATLARGVFFDLDALFRLAGQADFGPFSAADRERHALPEDNLYVGAEGQTSLVWDARNDPVEATSGHFLAARASVSPIGTQHYLQLAPEARGYLPLSSSFSLAARASFGWAFDLSGNGVPLGPRLFGGGSFGMRGFGRDRLSPVQISCIPLPGISNLCRETVVGGLSLAEMQLELRYLPALKQAGITTFVDFGGAGTRANPFEEGISIAAGLGPRLRLWYVPLSLDIGYRFVDRNTVGDGGLLVFARIGEAF